MMPFSSEDSFSGPHQGQPVARAGAPLPEARAAMILIHGRGASAESILSLAEELAQPGVAYLAPQAAGHTWYPHSFLAPLDRNEPGLSSGLQAVRDVLAEVEEGGIPLERCFLLGFSQGACLAAEFAARHPHRYGGVIVLSGGLIGNGMKPGDPPEDKTFEYDGSLDGTPVFVGCSDVDAHIPVSRVHRTAEVLEGLGASVDKRIYPGMGHTINDDELSAVQAIMRDLVQSSGE